MAKRKRKKKRDQDRSPIKLFLYTISVLVLIACLVFFVYRDGLKEKEFEQQIENLSASELSDMWDEFENELGSESLDAPDSEENQDSSSRKKSVSDSENTQPVTPTVTEAPSEETFGSDSQLPEGTPSPADLLNTDLTGTPVPPESAGLTLLVLNGTRRPGVAGYWKNVLEQAGYTNVVPANYTGTVGSQTTIYTDDPAKAEPLLAQFPNAIIQIGSITTGLEPSSDTPLPLHTDIYILIGNSDAIMS